MVAYYSGNAAAAAITHYGLYAALAVAALLASGWLLVGRT